MDAAATALALGLNPVTYLTAAPGDAYVLQAVLEKAAKSHTERVKAEADYLAAAMAAQVVPPLLKGLARFIRSLTPRGTSKK